MAKVKATESTNQGGDKSTEKSLASIMRDKYDDGLFDSDVGLGVIQSGFPLIDYGLGFGVDIYQDREWKEREVHKGILEGSYMIITGDSGTGKTTLASQLAGNIIRPYDQGMVYYFDLERATILSHIMDITRYQSFEFDEDNPKHRWTISQNPADAETIQKTILRIYMEKMANPEKYTITLNQKDSYGNPIVTMQPSVVVIDSIPMIGSVLDANVAKDARKMETALTQMDAAQTAGAFKRMMKMVLGPMKKTNIILIGITHLGVKINSNPMIPNKKDFRSLGQDEIIAGGKMNTYGATNIIRTNRRGGKGYTTENGDGFNGFDSMITVIKSRTTFDAKAIPMIYDCDYGFDNVRSLIQYGIDHGMITGNRASMKFTADPDCRFSYVKLYEEIAKKPEIIQNISKIILPSLEEPFKKKEDTRDMMSIFFEY